MTADPFAAGVARGQQILAERPLPDPLAHRLAVILRAAAQQRAA